MKRIVRSLLWAIFIIYCFVVIYMVFLSREFRTQYSHAYYFKHFTNFVPFKTILNYIAMYKNGYQALSIYNLLGNFVLFLPMGALLPCVFRGLNRFGRVVPCILVMVITIEVLQFVLRVGIIDVDDVIFNLIGAMLGYGIIKIPFLNRLMRKISFIDEGDNKAL